ncbi:Phytoene dehydrogenase and related proteins [Actinomycetales bacterium JB111]|nr:Phytoene dehydrogenase and related proteins [Actinomycetales bacterium JB111]
MSGSPYSVAHDPLVAGRTASVVGSGPNGLSAAVALARAGVRVTVYEAGPEPGGATRSAAVLGPGTTVDLGSAVHPFGVASPFLRTLDLSRHGLEWVQPDIPVGHPLDDGPAAVQYRSLARTAADLGPDGSAWWRLYAPLVGAWEETVAAFLGPMLRPPRHPVALARLSIRGALPAQAIARALFRTERARALFAGTSAHAVLPLDRPLTAAFGVLFGAAAHATGWPVARGGSDAIAAALVAELESYGGRVVTGAEITDLAQVRPADVVLLDLGPHAVADVAGAELPAAVVRGLRGWRYGTGVHKVDYLLDGPVPWNDARLGRAGTVHLGGSLMQIAAAERDVHAGRHPGRPFVLVAQQSAIDVSRAPTGQQVLYAYAHTPAGSTVAVGDRVDAQIERFAPGFRDRVIGRVESSPADLERWNANLVGGDVIGGSMGGAQLLLRPRATLRPYSLGAPGLFMCSASTPPGGGVHGMNGYHAARAALAHLRRGARSTRAPAPTVHIPTRKDSP